MELENYYGNEGSEDEMLRSDEEDKKTEKPSKMGRKQDWPDKITTDLVDIISSDDNLKTKLLLTNVKTVKKCFIFCKIKSNVSLVTRNCFLKRSLSYFSPNSFPTNLCFSEAVYISSAFC